MTPTQWRALMHQFLAQKDSDLPRQCFHRRLHFRQPRLNLHASPAGMEAYRFSMQSVRSWADQTLESEATKTLFGSFATFLRRRRPTMLEAQSSAGCLPQSLQNAGQQSGQRRNASRYACVG